MDYEKILDYYFPKEKNAELRNILITHSKSVAEKARDICITHPELNADPTFTYEAAMLHDIGIVECDAKGIYCFGSEPYIKHGIVGAGMLEEYAHKHMAGTDITPYTRVCARHTGTGLTAKMIKEQSLPLPAMDLIPETIEERIICYADKFFSKTRLDGQKEFCHVVRSLGKFGQDGVEIFLKWHEEFGC